ncbi:hypothetical protein [Oceaniglobus roseus]|uniref:hypothetical protein n=1 Tax=Oceaniglobus roseus TaxID=1737570 RepID=UPI000C7EF49C|nr:hypothetical protein [Kandeliimicrobium roseum]
MKRTYPLGLLALILALIAGLGAMGLARGGLYADRYEGDMMHLFEIVLRIADGQMPHLDFMTPLGLLSAWPIAVFVEAGQGIGMAVHMGQMLVALALVPALLRAASSRFSGWLGYGFALLVVVTVMALVHGGADPNISMSMHYNRWAWGYCFVALTLAVLPPLGRDRPWLDGALIALVLVAVVMIKITYAVVLAPLTILALLLRGARSTLVAGLVAGALALAGLTLLLGPAYWQAYANDLIVTARSEVRPFPSRPLDQAMTAPLFLGMHLLALLAVVLLRQSGRKGAGLVVLLLLPGFVYITYQNFGNDPQWSLWLALALLVLRPGPGSRNSWGWELRPALTMVACALLALGSPSFLNMAFSPLRHFVEDPAGYSPVFARSARHSDFLIPNARKYQVNLQIDGERAGGEVEGMAPDADRDAPTVLLGETLPVCSLENGMTLWFEAEARELERSGFADGTQILVADLLSPLPMFSDRMAWLKGGAPWRYEGVPGIKNADYLLVPTCAISPRTRRVVVDEVRARDIPLTEVYRSPRLILLRLG